MKIKISPKDTTEKIEMEIEYLWQEGRTFCVRFADSRIRRYPMEHIWYIESVPAEVK